MKKWLAVLTAVAVLAAGPILVVRHRAQVQRERDRAAALSLATRSLATWQRGDFASLGALTAAD